MAKFGRIMGNFFIYIWTGLMYILKYVIVDFLLLIERWFVVTWRFLLEVGYIFVEALWKFVIGIDAIFSNKRRLIKKG